MKNSSLKENNLNSSSRRNPDSQDMAGAKTSIIDNSRFEDDSQIYSFQNMKK